MKYEDLPESKLVGKACIYKDALVVCYTSYCCVIFAHILRLI